MDLSILGSQHGGRQTPMDVGGGTGTVLQLISTGDPFDLTGLEVRAHGEGEDHRRGVGCFEILQGQGHGVNPAPVPP